MSADVKTKMSVKKKICFSIQLKIIGLDSFFYNKKVLQCKLNNQNLYKNSTKSKLFSTKKTVQYTIKYRTNRWLTFLFDIFPTL